MYLVYVHTCPNGKRYVGMTRQKPNNRWRSGQGYLHCVDFYNAVIEFGWRNITHEIIANDLTKEEAESLERQLIKDFKTTDPRYGYNCHSGGLSGATINKVTRKRMSVAQSGEGNPRYGKHCSNETKDKIGTSKRGKPLTDAHKRKLGEVLGGDKNPAARPVVQYDINMNFIAKWPYIRAAKKETGASNISSCCTGKQKTSGGYIWRYADEVGGV